MMLNAEEQSKILIAEAIERADISNWRQMSKICRATSHWYANSDANMYLARSHLFTFANYVTCFAVAVTFFAPATGYSWRRNQTLNTNDWRWSIGVLDTALPGDYLTRFMFHLYCDRSRDFFIFPLGLLLIPAVGWECKTASANGTFLALSTPLTFILHYAGKTLLLHLSP